MEASLSARLSLQRVWALALNEAKESVAVPLSIIESRDRTERFSSNLDPSSQEACFNALLALRKMNILNSVYGIYFYVPGYIRRVCGPSLGLAAALALMRFCRHFDDAEPLWATGEVTPFGSVLPVGAIEIKLAHPAIRQGRVIIPSGYPVPPSFNAWTVGHLDEILAAWNTRRLPLPLKELVCRSASS